MPAPILHLQDITLTLGGKPLLDGAELGVAPSERLCLVGRNGSGKSTLLRIAAAEIAADSGRRFVQPGTKIVYLPQDPDLSGSATTLEYASRGLPEDETYRARAMLAELGLTGDETTATLSGGEARRCALAHALAAEPDLLLLDEPTNHLDLPAIEWLERELLASRAAMIVISHDRRLLETLSRGVVWLDRGVTRRLDQGFAAYEQWREDIIEQDEVAAHKLSRQIVREEDWMRHGVSGRRKRNVRRVAELAALRQQHRDTRFASTDGPKLEASGASGAAKIVVTARGAGRSFGDRAIVRDLDLRVLRGDRLAIVGANGAGKTTLLRLLTGVDAPDRGTIEIGASLSMVSLDQRRAELDLSKTLSDTLTGGGGEMVRVGEETRHVIGYMKDFLFRPEQARTPVAHLSGGERGRLALACALARPSNLIVLDEPTNDLDIETLDLLQDMLAEYPGTVLIVSHDRDFLDRVATSVLFASGDGHWQIYAGGYSDMIAQGGAGVGNPSGGNDTPKKIATKPKSETKKLSFKDKVTLDKLPARMAALEATIAKTRTLLADPGLYTTDPKAFARHTDALADAEAQLAATEEEWLALEMKREEIEG